MSTTVCRNGARNNINTIPLFLSVRTYRQCTSVLQCKQSALYLHESMMMHSRGMVIGGEIQRFLFSVVDTGQINLYELFTLVNVLVHTIAHVDRATAGCGGLLTVELAD